MIILDTTTKKLQAYTSAAPSADLTFYTSYVDIDSNALSNIAASNGVFDENATDIVAAPTGTVKRQVKSIMIYNASNGTQEVNIALDVSGTDTILWKLNVASSSTLVYENGQWQESEIATIGSDLITLSAVNSTPTTPGADTLLLYDYPIAGRQMLRTVGSSGLDITLQPSLFGNGILMLLPNTTTTMNAIGTVASTNVGTMSTPALTSASLRTSSRRSSVVSAATANSASEVRIAYASVWRGSGAGLGGFFFRCRFATGSAVATQRLIVGLTSATTAIATTQDPAALTNCVFIGNGTGDANLQIMANDGAGVCQQVDLGSSFPSFTADQVIDVTFFCAANSSTIGYSVTLLNDGSTASGTLSGSELPVNTTFLAPHIYMNNGGTAAAVTLDVMKLYIETDQ
jgi:hypothetical protein